MMPRIVLASAGFLAMAFSGFFLFVGWAFASMVDPALKGWDRSSAIFQKLFNFSEAIGWEVAACLIWFAVGFIVFAGAIVSMIRGQFRPKVRAQSRKQQLSL